MANILDFQENKNSKNGFMKIQSLYEQSDIYPQILSKRYAEESEFMYQLSQGNLEACKKFYKEGKKMQESSHGLDIYNRFPDNLRSLKNALIVLNTICRVSARNGGVLPSMLNLISCKYALLIENSHSSTYLTDTVWPFMIVEYCTAVNHFSQKNYSETTSKIVDYIINNLPSPLSVNSLAEKFYLHPSSLARKFKAETGFNLTDFINVHRIKYAQYMFNTGKENITEVATMVGYNDSNYFCRVFKKKTSMSPRQYIQKTKEENVIF